jgi:hypothetical protein
MTGELLFFQSISPLLPFGKSHAFRWIRIGGTFILFPTHPSLPTTHPSQPTTHSANGLSCTIYLTYDQAGVKIIPSTRVRVRTASTCSFSPIARGRIWEMRS